jgi:hypothetical protein
MKTLDIKQIAEDFGLLGVKQCIIEVKWDGYCAIKKELEELWMIRYKEENSVNTNVVEHPSPSCQFFGFSMYGVSFNIILSK